MSQMPSVRPWFFLSQARHCARLLTSTWSSLSSFDVFLTLAYFLLTSRFTGICQPRPAPSTTSSKGMAVL